jgi:pimeloyl-ACP methyl ester carboxylesterase
MDEIKRDFSFIDIPDITRLVFYPRKHQGSIRQNNDTILITFSVDDGVEIVSRFYKAQESKSAPIILSFHGNGEIITDYDFIAPSYQQMGINLLVTDYRGYGKSTGHPNFSNMLGDAHKIYQQFRKFLIENGYIGSVSVMGRSLGSASAIELAWKYQKQISCVIIESGFVNTYNLLHRLGISFSLLPDNREIDVSPLPLLKTIKIPTLVIHGENDVIIPLEDGMTLYKNLASNKKELLIIPNAGHNDLLLIGPNDYMDAIKKIIFESEE